MKIDIILLKDINDDEFHNIRLKSGNKNEHPPLSVLREHLPWELVKGKKLYVWDLRIIYPLLTIR
jgi:hypothetical protein